MIAKLTVEVVSRDKIKAEAPSDGILGKWWVAFAASSAFVVGGHLLIKAGLASLTPIADAGLVSRVLQTLSHLPVLAGLMVYMIGTVCWMRAVSMKEISFLYPISSINYVLVAIGSVWLFQETLSGRRLAGIAVIVVGMILMNRRTES